MLYWWNYFLDWWNSLVNNEAALYVGLLTTAAGILASLVISFRKNKKTNDSPTVNFHTGAGDNVARDKIINNNYGLSGIVTIIIVVTAIIIYLSYEPPKKEYKVQLQIPLGMKNVTVFVDGKQAENIDQSNSIINLKLRSKESKHSFIIEADNKKCEFDALVVKDGQKLTFALSLCEPIHQPSTYHESKPIKLNEDVGLRLLPDVEKSAYCKLKATDYILPLEVTKSLNKVWCKVRVVDSKNCRVGYEGFIRPAKVCNLPY
ncbi:MAG: hypothetical protein H6936_05315 [Burkholderiales bacterium]|nr:hypothetical protein [Burkholderiales bacterium]